MDDFRRARILTLMPKCTIVLRDAGKRRLDILSDTVTVENFCHVDINPSSSDQYPLFLIPDDYQQLTFSASFGSSFEGYRVGFMVAQDQALELSTRGFAWQVRSPEDCSERLAKMRCLATIEYGLQLRRLNWEDWRRGEKSLWWRRIKFLKRRLLARMEYRLQLRRLKARR